MVYFIQDIAHFSGLCVLHFCLYFFIFLTIIKDIFVRILKIIFVFPQKVKANSYVPCNLSLSFV